LWLRTAAASGARHSPLREVSHALFMRVIYSAVETVTDFKSGPRIVDPELMRQAHWAFDECVICGGIDISIHHIIPRGGWCNVLGDDVWENLVPLCGSGTHGCHGGVEAGLDSVCHALGRYVVEERPDTMEYLLQKFDTVEARGEFLRRSLRVVS
jgi:hypothetical protein